MSGLFTSVDIRTLLRSRSINSNPMTSTEDVEPTKTFRWKLGFLVMALLSLGFFFVQMAVAVGYFGMSSEFEILKNKFQKLEHEQWDTVARVSNIASEWKIIR